VTYITISATNDTPGDRVITPNKLKAEISEYDDLNENQRDQLLAVLMKYQPHLTKRPGKCNGFEYHFNIVGKLLKSASSRTIPFALRDDFRAQIQDMLNDGILEESYLDYVNPLTRVLREHKPFRICVDARGMNRHDSRQGLSPNDQIYYNALMVLDILQLWISAQLFSRYIPPAKSSRKWTAFNFEKPSLPVH
jgi:hypothetical protein